MHLLARFHINRGARWLFRRRVDRAGVEQDQVVLVNDLRAAANRQTIRNRSIHFEQDKTAVVGDDAVALNFSVWASCGLLTDALCASPGLRYAPSPSVDAFGATLDVCAIGFLAELLTGLWADTGTTNRTTTDSSSAVLSTRISLFGS